MPVCIECGKENPDEARFCLACGLRFAPAAPERRKLATLLFCDMSGSTAMGERVDAESVRNMMFRYFHTMRDAIERHGGTVEKFIGDAVMAVFGIPEAHEDDALRAVRAASEMQARLVELNPELERRFGSTIALRIGVNTGEVVAGDATSRQTLVTGDAVNVAARLEQAAAPGEVLLGEPTYRLCRDAVAVEPVAPLSLKGKSEPLPAYRLLGVTPGAPGHARRLEAPMVGREQELTLLQEFFAEAEGTRSCRLVTVVGEPGVGKSRLSAELLSSLAGKATILQGRCLSYGEGITFWPIGEIVREAAGILDEHTQEEGRARIASLLEGEEQADLIATRVAQAIGLEGGQAAAEEIGWAIRKLFEALARNRPLLLFVDDLHWAEPALLDLLAQLPTFSHEAPILLLCLARPELLEERPEWEAQVRLEPLAESDSGRLLENLLGNATIAPAVRKRIARAAGGNPLFVEELVAMLVEDDLLRRENGSWVASAELEQITIPPTLSTLLGARLDQLGEERASLERGAIEGQVFHRGAVAALSSPDGQAALAQRLATLVAKELLRPAQASFEDEAAFRFRHILIRDAAYQGTPKKLRAELHERFADWLEKRAGERVTEYEEILGYHLEQAYRYLEELGPVDETGRALASRAAGRLGAAGKRAAARGDATAAATLLKRAASLLEGQPARLDLLSDLAAALVLSGDYGAADRTILEVLDAASACGDDHLLAHALIQREELRSQTDPQGFCDRALRVGEEAIPVFESLGDDQGLSRAWNLVAQARAFRGELSAFLRASERALGHAERAGDERQEVRSRGGIAEVWILDATPLEDAERLAEQNRGWAKGRNNIGFEAESIHALGIIRALRGQVEEGLKLAARGRATLEDLGQTVRVAAIHGAGPLALVGEPAEVEARLRSSYEALERLGEKGFLSTVAANLAEAVYRQGRYDDAEHWTKISEELGADDDLYTQIGWRCVRAKVLAREGREDDAQRLAEQVVALTHEREDVDLRAEVLMSLAEVLRLGGRAAEARPYLEQALALWEQKGNVVFAERALAALAALEAPVG